VTVSGLATNTTYYVWVRNVDFSDNRSAFSSRATFTTAAGIPTADIADGAVTEAKVATDAISTLKVVEEAVTSAVSVYTAIPEGIKSTFGSLGSVAINWGATAALVPDDVVCTITVALGNVTATLLDTIEFRLKVGSTDYDYYFQDIDPAGVQFQLVTFQIVVPTGNVTGSVTYELFARCTVNASDEIYAYNRSANFVGLKR